MFAFCHTGCKKHVSQILKEDNIGQNMEKSHNDLSPQIGGFRVTKHFAFTPFFYYVQTNIQTM